MPPAVPRFAEGLEAPGEGLLGRPAPGDPDGPAFGVPRADGPVGPLLGEVGEVGVAAPGVEVSPPGVGAGLGLGFVEPGTGVPRLPLAPLPVLLPGLEVEGL